MPSAVRAVAWALLAAAATCVVALFGLRVDGRRRASGAQPAALAEADARGAALTQKLEDVFTAPLDALANYVHGMAPAGQRAPAAEQPSSHHTSPSPSLASGPSSRGWGLPGMGGWGQTGNWGDSGRLRAEHGDFDGHRSAMRLPVGVHPYTRHHGEPWRGVRTGRSNDFQVIGTGPRTPEGFHTQYGTQYSKSENNPLPVGPSPSGWYPYDVPIGKGGETHFASIRVDDYACGGPGRPPCQVRWGRSESAVFGWCAQHACRCTPAKLFDPSADLAGQGALEARRFLPTIRGAGARLGLVQGQGVLGSHVDGARVALHDPSPSGRRLPQRQPRLRRGSPGGGCRG